MNLSIVIHTSLQYFTLVLLMISFAGITAQTETRIEPPHWWIEMEHDTLQLLVHHPNIASCDQVDVNSSDIRVISFQRVQSPNYLFISIALSKKLQPGSYSFSLHLPADESLQFDYLFESRRGRSAGRNGFDSSDVIYLLMPDRFANGNPENDDVANVIEHSNRALADGRHGGDIEGIIHHLDYLADLGITAIWSTPLLLDDEATNSYHGYATTDYYQIDPRYGTNSDYQRLAQECHKRGLKLIMDMVPNHCGGAHWWMEDLPQQDWVHQFPEFTRSNHRKQTVNDPHSAKSDRIHFEKGWFDITMPDLNQSNELLLQYLIQQALWWIEYADLDGLRVDTYIYNDKWPIARWTQAIRREYPNLNIMGECWQERPSEIAYWQSGMQNPDGYDSGLPTVMDFCLWNEMQEAFNEDDQRWDQGMVRLYNVLAMDYLYPDPDNLLIFLDNHDINRFSETVSQDMDKFKLALSFLLTTRGIPQIYSGTELMMPGQKLKGDGDLRKDFPGGWPNDNRNAFTTSGRTEKENDVFDHLSTLLNWRKNCKAIHSGQLIHFIPEDNIYVYFRKLDEELVVIVLNNNPVEKKLNLNRFKEVISNVRTWYSVLDKKNYTLSSEIVLNATSALILQKIDDER